MSYFLSGSDYVGVSFWLVYDAMIAATVFFFYEGFHVKKEWRLSLLVAGLVTLVAAIHYDYMRDYWVYTLSQGEGKSPIVYRYIDWIITVPLQIVEFYLILAAVNKVPGSMFWRLLVASLVMLIFGYLGEAGYMSALLGFIIATAAWIYIIFELFSGAAGKAMKKSGNKAMKTAFSAMRLIVTVGWAIYPLGYLFGYLLGGVDANALNIIYNFADFLSLIHI